VPPVGHKLAVVVFRLPLASFLLLLAVNQMALSRVTEELHNLTNGIRGLRGVQLSSPPEGFGEWGGLGA
jgi:hypothetical protein